MSRAAAGVGLARVAFGAGWLSLLAVGARFAGGRLPPSGRIAATVLAGRDIAQGAMLVRSGDAAVEAGAVIDALHAASMVPVIAFAPRYRLAGAVSASLAVGWLVAAVAVRRADGHLR